MKNKSIERSSRIKKTVLDPATIDIQKTVEAISLLKNTERILTTRMDADLDFIRAQFAGQLADLRATVEIHTLAAQTWAEANPDQFAKRKTMTLTHGKIGFRTGTPKVELLSRRWTWKKALAAVQDFLTEFIRDVPEIDKEAILTDYARGATNNDELATAGLKVTQDESFFVEPNLTPLETRVATPITAAPLPSAPLR